MLPSLCAAFLTGLVLGSLFTFFPTSIILALALSIVALWIAERVGAMEPMHATTGYAAVLLGVVYWVSVVPSPETPHAFDETPVDVTEVKTGRIIGPVQHAPHRVTLLVRIELPREQRISPQTVRLTWRDPGPAVFHGDRIAFRDSRTGQGLLSRRGDTLGGKRRPAACRHRPDVDRLCR